ncbi:uncharacterized protein LOC128363328 [Scomber japonicus]|uniref:uncharacterized protein LOC128363328 n=1 Tax=Scomber japonicus TaxID=13676 RepID=UPI0023051B3B|nr:uncharacterized protein LOC128363328 [Scomber japonicus]
MIVLWVTLLVLHQGYALIPVITVQLGEPANFTCALSDELSRKNVHWYKQSAGDTLKLIVKLSQYEEPEYAPEFSPSKLKAHRDKNISNLTILRTTQKDEGMYHCGVTDWINTEWSGTYLLVKENSERTSNYTVVQGSTVSDPVHPGDSVTLQCSVLSDSGNKTCSGGHSVYWFRTGSDGSHPDIIYTDGSSPDECRKKSDMNLSPKSCDYHFSKKVSSSDAGTYYCAVATCGKILFGNGNNQELVQTTHSLFIGIVILTVCLAVSVVANVVLICNQSLKVCEQCKAAAALQTYIETTSDGQQI